MQSLTNKWALVTGSSRGIGQQIALGLAQQECNAVIHGGPNAMFSVKTVIPRALVPTLLEDNGPNS